MIFKERSRRRTCNQKFFMESCRDGRVVLCFQFDLDTRLIAIKTPDDLGRLMMVLTGCTELETVHDGDLTLRHAVGPVPGYWFTIGQGSAGKPPQDNAFAFFLTNAEAFVLTEALRMKCARMMEED